MTGASKCCPLRRSNALYLTLAAACTLVGLWILVGHKEWSVKDPDLQPGSISNKAVDVLPVTVTVFYEVLCPDSKSFIRQQLFPTWDRLQDSIKIDFKPFGKGRHQVKPDGDHEFECQHGLLECQGNIVHNCAIKYVPQPMNYVSCMMDEIFRLRDAEAVGEECAKRLQLDWEPIKRCYQGPEGRQLMALVADETLSMNPPITFIPTILLDGSREPQDLALRNLMMAVCQKFKDSRPEACS